jgi:hypothetical protein
MAVFGLNHGSSRLAYRHQPAPFQVARMVGE